MLVKRSLRERKFPKVKATDERKGREFGISNQKIQVEREIRGKRGEGGGPGSPICVMFRHKDVIPKQSQ